MNHHSTGLPNQTSETAHFEPTQGHQKCDWEVLDEFGGLTKVAIYSHSVILLQTVVVLAFPIPGLTNAGSWDTQLPYKQLNNTNWGCPS